MKKQRTPLFVWQSLKYFPFALTFAKRPKMNNSRVQEVFFSSTSFFRFDIVKDSKSLCPVCCPALKSPLTTHPTQTSGQRADIRHSDAKMNNKI